MLKELRGGLSFDSTASGSSVRLFFPIPEKVTSIEHQKTEPSKPNANTVPQHSTSIVNWNAIKTRSDRTESPSIPPPSWSAIGTINDWQDAATQRLLWGTFALFSLGTLVGVLQLKGYRLNVITTGLVPLAALALAATRRNWSVRVRGSLLVLSLFYTGSLLLSKATFMSPAAVAMLSLAILLAAELMGHRASQVTAGATFCLFLIGGFLYRKSGGAIGHNFLNPSDATSWWRIGLFLALVQFLFSWAALHVVHSSRRQLSRAHRALQRYEEAQRERQRLSDAAIATNAMLARISRMETAGRLIGTVAHDLNNSLQAIVTWTELLKTDHSPEFCKEALDGIEQSTDYAEALIQQIQLGRTERGTARSIDIGRTLTEMRPMLESVLHRNHNEHLTLEMSIEPHCFVKIQQATLRRMMLNLVANARDAMPSTGRCSIELSRQDANILLSVTDSGIGMDALTLARVSEPFFTTKGDHGTGLGLHSVKELMSATNGRIELQSRVGEGTRVFLYWRLSAAPETPSVPRITRDASRGKGRILLVEDEEGVLNVLRRALERAGYQVVTARDGDEAMRRITEDDFDVLCTDAVMPGCPTDRVIEDYAARNPKRPILLMSGHLPAEFSQTALSNPAVSFLSKPFGGRVLLNELERRLAQRH
jgi:signal transduction histidine kinase/CheY-like chemotaxis protein